MSDEMRDAEMSAAVQTAAAEKPVHDSARILALGVGLLLGGGGAVSWGADLSPLVTIAGICALIVGAFLLAVGVYRFADNVDRAAKALITGRRG